MHEVGKRPLVLALLAGGGAYVVGMQISKNGKCLRCSLKKSSGYLDELCKKSIGILYFGIASNPKKAAGGISSLSAMATIDGKLSTTERIVKSKYLSEVVI